MKKITVTIPEKWDSINEEFIPSKDIDLMLEHSLVSMSKWESKHHKAFLSKEHMSIEETVEYIKCMTITQNVDPEIYLYLSPKNIEEIEEYISDPMTATKIMKHSKGSSNKFITNEIIYSWMITLGIPFECQKWHLNRLLSLIEVCNEENAPKKKMSSSAVMKQNRALNEARKKARGTRG